MDISLLTAAVELSPHGIVITDAVGGKQPISFCNEAFLRMTGYSRAEIIGHDCRFLSGPETAADTRMRLRQAIVLEQAITVELLNYRKDGSTFWNRLSLTPLRNQAGLITNFLGIQVDLTETHKSLELDAANAWKESMQDAIESIRDAFGLFDQDDRLILCNQAYAGTFTPFNRFSDIQGWTFADLVRSSVLTRGEMIEPEFGGDLEAWVAERTRRHRRPGGDLRQIRFADGKWLQVSERPTKNGGIVGVRTDITELKQAQELAERLALTDSLTNLANRRQIMRRLDQISAEIRAGGDLAGVMLIDIDHFKIINDTRGHTFGDQLLIEFGQRLKHCLRECDTLARIGGDEFLASLGNMATSVGEAAERVDAVARHLLARLREPFEVGESTYLLTPSIGTAIFSAATTSVSELLKEVDMALYQAKSSGRNMVCAFNVAIRTEFLERVNMESSLRCALENRELQLHYQPQVNAQGVILGAEALLRWYPTGGPPVPPDKFIPVAEKNGLIVPIGNWVLHTACAQLTAWQADPATRDLTMSVNVSAVQFRQPDFMAQVLRILDATGARADRLKLEITESLLLGDFEPIVATISSLRHRGIRFCIDDFGTGYSSLNYLKRLPLDELKIDRSFVAELTEGGRDGDLVRFMFFLANRLKMVVVAEGIETETQRDVLLKEGCCIFQGYLFGKPVPITQFFPEEPDPAPLDVPALVGAAACG